MGYRSYRLTEFVLDRVLTSSLLGDDYIYKATYTAFADRNTLDAALEVAINVTEQAFGHNGVQVEKEHGASGQVTTWLVNSRVHRPAQHIMVNTVPYILIKDDRNAAIQYRTFLILNDQVKGGLRER